MTVLSSPTVLVTGARGKVGRAVLPRLVAAGFRVRAMSSADVTSTDSRIDRVRCDLRSADHDRLLEVVDGCVAVVHLAVEQHDPATMDDLNARASARLAAAAEQSGVRTFCFTSSIAVYGSPVARQATETTPLIDDDRDRPEQYWVHDSLRSYARSKVRAERALRAAASRVHYVVLRPSVIVDDDDLRTVAAMTPLQRALSWRQSTHHVALADVADALVWAVERGCVSPSPRFETFNLTDDADGGRYGALFTAAGSGRGRLHGVPLPAAPVLLLRALKWVRHGHVLPVRRPMGASSFPADALRAAGFRPAVGMPEAHRRAFAPAAPSAPERELAHHGRRSSSSSI